MFFVFCFLINKTVTANCERIIGLTRARYPSISNVSLVCPPACKVAGGMSSSQTYLVPKRWFKTCVYKHVAPGLPDCFVCFILFSCDILAQVINFLQVVCKFYYFCRYLFDFCWILWYFTVVWWKFAGFYDNSHLFCRNLEDFMVIYCYFAEIYWIFR